MSGRLVEASGRTSEDAVVAEYRRRGYRVRARRWRGAGGEIDLVVEHDVAGLVFVEVKSAASHALASARLAPAQVARICAAATEYLGASAGGLDSAARIDVALVDRAGRIEILENAIA